MKPNQLSKLARTSRSILIAALSLLGTCGLKAANFFDNGFVITDGNGTHTIDLGNASGGPSTTVSTHKNWAIFALSGGVTITDPDNSLQNVGNNYDVLGNVGMAGSGLLSLTNSWIKGSAYNTAGQISGPFITSTGNAGPTVNSAYLASAATSASNSSTAAANLVTNAGVGANQLVYGGALSGTPATIALSTAASITGTANQTYVLNLTDLILSGAGAVLTLNGASTTNYVINVNRYMALSASAQIKLGAGGIGQNNILYNVTNASTYDVTLSGASVVNGIILAPTRNAKLTGGSVVYGEVIAKGVSLSGRSKVINPYISP